MRYSFISLLFAFAFVNHIQSLDLIFNNGPWRSMIDRFQSMANDFNPVYEVDKSFKHSNIGTSESTFNPSMVIVDSKPLETESTLHYQDFHGPFFPLFQQPLWHHGNFFTTIRKQIPWWKGENICIERKVIEETIDHENGTNGKLNNSQTSEIIDTNMQISFSGANQFIFSSQISNCIDDETAHICTTRVRNDKINRTTIVRHECCHGYRRNGHGLPGCIAVNLKNMVDTLNELGSKQFAHIFASSSQIETRTKSNENITVFSPPDHSIMSNMPQSNVKENEIPQVKEEKKDEIPDTNDIPPSNSSSDVQPTEATVITTPEPEKKSNDLVTRHVVNGIYKLHDFSDNEILTSLNSNEKLRVNVYNNLRKVITVNCVPILSGDNPTINGIVHSVQRVLPSANQTLGQLIEKDEKFTLFTEFLKESGLFEKLNELDDQYTIFAPTNSALKQLDTNFLNRLRTGHPCFKNIIENHIVNNIYCSSGIVGENIAKTINSLEIMLRRTYDYKVYVQNIEIIDKDLIGTNGVLHGINGLILSESVEPVSKSIDTPLTSEFYEYLNKTNLLNEFNKKEDATFFIPTNDAFRRLSAERKEQLANDTAMILMYHITQPRLTSKHFYNNEILVSSVGKSVRINLYGDFPQTNNRITAQCANIVYQNKDTCKGVVHLIDRVLFPSKDTILQVIDSLSGYEIFKALLQVSNFFEKFNKENGPYTLLLPDDKAFRRSFNAKELDEYLNDTNKAMKLVQRHLIPEFVCCSGFNQMPFFFSFQQFRTLDGSSVSAIREFDGKIKVGSAEVRRCDQIANNGVVHLIDRVLYPKTSINMLPSNSIFNLFLNK